MWNFHALLRRLRIEDNFTGIEGLSNEQRVLETDFSATVFSGDPQQWIRYLGMSRAERYAQSRARIIWNKTDRTIIFQPEDAGAQEVATCLNSGLALLRQQLQHAPHAASALDDMIFGNTYNCGTHLNFSD